MGTEEKNVNYLAIAIVIGVFAVIGGWALQSAKEENAAWKEILATSKKLQKDWMQQQTQINRLQLNEEKRLAELETLHGFIAAQNALNERIGEDIDKLEAYAKRPQTLEIKPLKISFDKENPARIITIIRDATAKKLASKGITKKVVKKKSTKKVQRPSKKTIRKVKKQLKDLSH